MNVEVYLVHSLGLADGTKRNIGGQDKFVIGVDMIARYHPGDNAAFFTRAAHEAGVRFLAGTDSGGVPYLYYGSSLHDELALLVDAGFTSLQELQAATRDAAEFLGLGDTGTVAPGKHTDLVLLGADPLADIHNFCKIDAVILGGGLLGPNDLDVLLKTAVQKER